MNNEQRVKEILGLLRKLYPKPKTALDFRSPFELLTATVLSAQSTDVQVNRITKSLFKKYKSITDYASASPATFEKDVSGVNFYKTKAKNIQNSARLILEKYNSRVPESMDELVTLPGVARKTANIILSTAYGINEGIAVDTHVKRVALRLGLTKSENPVKIEQDLIAVTPKKKWANLSHLLILHGRRTCAARKPKHNECVLYDLCPSRDI